MPISTRRLAARACSLLPGTRGSDLPKPLVVMIVAEIPACTRKSRTASARRWESCRWNQRLRQNTDPDHQMTNIGGRRDLIHGEAQGRGSCPCGCLWPETVMRDVETVQGKTVAPR